MASHRHRRWARQLLRRPRGLSMPMATAVGIAFPFADGLTARPSAKGTASAGVGRSLPWANFADGRTLPMAWPSAKISICRWLGFVDGFAVGKDRLWRWPVFADVWTVGKISLPMAQLCHRQILWSTDGLFSGHRQTSRPSANKPFPVVGETYVSPTGCEIHLLLY